MKCRYSKCFHPSKEIGEDEPYIHEGNAYYHPDCYQTKKDIQEVNDLFYRRVDKNVVFAQLTRVVNTLVFEKGVAPKFLTFGINYFLDHNIPLKYPQGLYYVIQNQDVKKEWSRLQTNKMQKKLNNVKPTKDTETVFTYVPPKQKGFDDILK